MMDRIEYLADELIAKSKRLQATNEALITRINELEAENAAIKDEIRILQKAWPLQ